MTSASEFSFDAERGGAFEAQNLDQLLHGQAFAVKALCARAAEIVAHERRTPPEDARPDDSVLRRRPRNVFLVDGPRGAGKTTVLLTVQACFRQLCTPRTTPLLQEIYDAAANRSPQLNAARDPGPTAHAIFVTPEILPSDLEHQQSTMESIFASLRAVIERHGKDAKTRGDEEMRRQAEALVQQLDRNVAGSWRLSQASTTDAIQKDSISVEAYLKLSAEYGARAQRRVREWQDFLNGFLRLVKAELIAFFFDDTDTHPKASVDLLHSIRIFLDHPRVICVIAGNLKSIRKAMHQDGVALGSLEEGEPATGPVEEYLEKVLPPPNRYYIGGPTGAQERDNDEGKVYKRTFDAMCRAKLHSLRPAFLLQKLQAMGQPGALGEVKAIPGGKRDDLEAYVSWWLFRHYYPEALQPRTARQQMHFRRLMETSAPEGSGQRGKRLAVSLFEVSGNDQLISKFNDSDKNVLVWLRRQVLDSRWNRDRHFVVDDVKLAEGVYEYDYICFRIDLGISAPIFNNADEDIPEGLLPRPFFRSTDGLGRRLTRFVPPPGGYRVYGVARSIKSTVVPANCIYMHDLRAINDWMWRDGKARPFLCPPSRLHDIFDYDRATSNQVFRSASESAVPRHVCDRLREWVVPLAALAQLRTDMLEPTAPQPWHAPEGDEWSQMPQWALDHCNEEIMAVEQWSGGGVSSENDQAGSEVASMLGAQQSWNKLGDLLREKDRKHVRLDGAPEKLPLREKMSPPAVKSKSLRAINLNSFGAYFNDYVSAHLATRIYKSDVAAVLRSADQFLSSEIVEWSAEQRKVAARYRGRALQFSPAEPARVIVLEDIQDLIEDAVALGSLPKNPSRDTPVLLKKLKEFDTDPRAPGAGIFRSDQQMNLSLIDFFAYPVLARKPKPRRADRSTIDIEVFEATARTLVDLVFLGKTLTVEQAALDADPECARWFAVWQAIKNCENHESGALARLVGIPEKAPSEDLTWMWPEYDKFAIPARVSRAFLLYVYGLAPSLRSLYEIEWMAHKAAAFCAPTPSSRGDRYPNAPTPIQASGWPKRAQEWVDAAAAMRLFVCRFANVGWLSHWRTSLHATMHGPLRDRPPVRSMIEDVEKCLLQRGHDSRHFSSSCGTSFALVPDISLETLGIMPGRYGVIQSAYDALGDFIEMAAEEVPVGSYPASDYPFTTP